MPMFSGVLIHTSGHGHVSLRSPDPEGVRTTAPTRVAPCDIEAPGVRVDRVLAATLLDYGYTIERPWRARLDTFPAPVHAIVLFYRHIGLNGNIGQYRPEVDHVTIFFVDEQRILSYPPQASQFRRMLQREKSYTMLSLCIPVIVWTISRHRHGIDALVV